MPGCVFFGHSVFPTVQLKVSFICAYTKQTLRSPLEFLISGLAMMYPKVMFSNIHSSLLPSKKKRLSYNGLFTERAQDYMINDHESKHVVKHLD